MVSNLNEYSFAYFLCDKLIFNSVALFKGWADCSEWGCTTSYGPDPNKTCIFPFKYRGKTYNCCTFDDNYATDTDAWCSTKVDRTGEHLSGQGKYGFCEPKCQPKPAGKFS